MFKIIKQKTISTVRITKTVNSFDRKKGMGKNGGI